MSKARANTLANELDRMLCRLQKIDEQHAEAFDGQPITCAWNALEEAVMQLRNIAEGE